jgi:Tfp pilus assembly protein PilN
MRAVNLLPRDVDASGSGRSLKPVLVLLGAVVALTAVFGVLRLNASAQADGARADLELAESALASLPTPEPQPAAPDVSAERSNRIAALQSALATRVPVDRLLHDLSYVVPDDVWLTGFSLSIPSAAAEPGAPASPGATPATVTIEGATFSQPSIARFLARLAALSSLGDSRLTESARVEQQPEASGAGTKKKARKKAKPKVVLTFTVTADLALGARS